ncbi:MAG: hypothetical protein KDJ99_30520 [Candidatus Competibacteraceae bacterium]|nr:hypothetical protein [Candidatus Competibacteraceae bacterium]
MSNVHRDKDRVVKTLNPAKGSLFFFGIVVFALWLLIVRPAFGGKPVVDFNIPASKADRALNLFALQAEVQLIYPYDLVSEITLKGLFGKYSVSEGLKVLISDTCLEADFSADNNVTLNANSAKGFWFMRNNRCGNKSLIGAVIAAVVAGGGAAEVKGDDSKTLEEPDSVTS